MGVFKLATAIILVGLATLGVGCMTYGQPYQDHDRRVVYVPYAKKAFGVATDSGILTCTTQDVGLICVRGPRIVDRLPISAFCGGPDCGAMAESKVQCADKVESDGWLRPSQANFATAQMTPPPSPTPKPAPLPTAPPTPPPPKPAEVQQARPPVAVYVEPEIDVSNEPRPEFCNGEATSKIRLIDLSGGWSAAKVSEVLQCWKGKRVKVYGRDNFIFEGVLVGTDSDPAPSIRIWGVSGKKSRLLTDLVRVERL